MVLVPIYRIGALFMSSIKELLELGHLCIHTLFLMFYLCSLVYMFWCILRDGIEKEESFDCQERADGRLQYFVSIMITG